MRVVAIVQARMGSTRLPGKVLMDLAGEPMLARVIRRVARAKTLHHVGIATTMLLSDQAIVGLCQASGWACVVGSEDDVLDRYYQAARQWRACAVVRITADCPFVDPTIIDTVVSQFLDRQPQIDYASNVFPRRTFPRGLDTEVLRFETLERVHREDRSAAGREHVTPFIYRHPQRFGIHSVAHDADYSYLRWVVDTSEDLQFARAVYAEVHGRDDFNWKELIRLLEGRPELVNINRHALQRAIEGGPVE